MDPNYLLKDELEFELACRGIHIKNVAPILRQVLRELLSSEQTGATSYTIKAPKSCVENPATELGICFSKLDIIAQYLSEIQEKPDKPLFRKLVSRLFHVQNRLDLIVTSDQADEKLKDDLKKKAYDVLSKLEERDHIIEDGNLTLENKKILQETLGAVGDKIIESIEKKIDNSVEVIKEKETKTTHFENCGNEMNEESGRKMSRLFRASTFDESSPKRKLVPISQWQIKFSGDNSVNAFIERIEEIKDARNATDDDIWRYAIDFFEGEALIWYRANKKFVRDWNELKTLLKHTFQSPFYQDELLKEIYSRTQGKQESVTIYIAVMQNMFNRLPSKLSEREQISIILKNLQPSYQRAVCRDTFTSIFDLTNILRIIERTEVNCQKFQEPKNLLSHLEPDLAYCKSQLASEICEVKATNVATNAAEQTRRCWNCRELGHTFRLCKVPKQRLFCYNCGKFGFSSKTCSCKGNEQGESSPTAK